MTASRAKVEALARRLAGAGFLDGADEARQLVAASGGDPEVLECWTRRRLDGEPLAWITGATTFLGHLVQVARGVYVPRPQTELVARRAIARLPERGVAVDLCTGSGAIAVALRAARPHARVLASDIDAGAVGCAAGNGVEVYHDHLADPLPSTVLGDVDVVVAVVPYVPTGDMVFLPRDVRRHEPRHALDGGAHGTDLLVQVVRAAPSLLRRGGSLVLELGGEQDELLLPVLADAGFDPAARLVDAEGDLRGIEATRR